MRISAPLGIVRDEKYGMRTLNLYVRGTEKNEIRIQREKRDRHENGVIQIHRSRRACARYDANLGSEVGGPSISTEEGRLVLGTYAS